METVNLRDPQARAVIHTELGNIPEDELILTPVWSASESDLVCAIEYRLKSEGENSPFIRRDVYVHLKKGAELGAKLAKIG